MVDVTNTVETIIRARDESAGALQDLAGSIDGLKSRARELNEENQRSARGFARLRTAGTSAVRSLAGQAVSLARSFTAAGFAVQGVEAGLEAAREALLATDLGTGLVEQLDRADGLADQLLGRIQEIGQTRVRNIAADLGFNQSNAAANQASGPTVIDRVENFIDRVESGIGGSGDLTVLARELERVQAAIADGRGDSFAGLGLPGSETGFIVTYTELLEQLQRDTLVALDAQAELRSEIEESARDSFIENAAEELVRLSEAATDTRQEIDADIDGIRSALSSLFPEGDVRRVSVELVLDQVQANRTRAEVDDVLDAVQQESDAARESRQRSILRAARERAAAAGDSTRSDAIDAGLEAIRLQQQEREQRIREAAEREETLRQRIAEREREAAAREAERTRRAAERADRQAYLAQERAIQDNARRLQRERRAAEATARNERLRAENSEVARSFEATTALDPTSFDTTAAAVREIAEAVEQDRRAIINVKTDLSDEEKQELLSELDQLATQASEQSEIQIAINARVENLRGVQDVIGSLDSAIGSLGDVEESRGALQAARRAAEITQAEEDLQRAREQGDQAAIDSAARRVFELQQISAQEDAQNRRRVERYVRLQAAIAFASAVAGAAQTLADPTNLTPIGKLAAYATIIAAGLSAVSTIRSVSYDNAAADVSGAAAVGSAPTPGSLGPTSDNPNFNSAGSSDPTAGAPQTIRFIIESDSDNVPFSALESFASQYRRARQRNADIDIFTRAA